MAKRSTKTSKAELTGSADAVSCSEQTAVRKKCSAFTKGLLIYSAALIIIALVALLILYGFLNAYEHSRPLTCIKDYLAEIQSEGLNESCLAALDILDENLQTREESKDYIMQILPDIKYGKSSKLSTPESPAYILTYNDEVLGTVYLSALDKHPFGLTFWKVEHDEFDFSDLANSHTLVLPDDYSVFVNGHELDSQYIVEDAIEYDTLSNFYAYYDNLPRLTKYESGKYIGEENLRVLDADGNEVNTDELSEADFLSNCSEETVADIKEFTDEFVRRYVTYAANLNGSWFANYNNARYLTVPGSQLENRLQQAMGSFGYSTIYSCDILSNEINICAKFDDVYIVDITYITETLARANPVQEENNIRLAVVPYGETYLAEAMFNY